jgi:hypothetical protein
MGRPMSPAPPRSRNLLLGLLALLATPAAVRANMAPRYWGHLVEEPGGIAEVLITHEDLTIDLRPLAEGQPARVEVSYRLHNPGAAKQARLAFVSGTDVVQHFEVRLNDRVIVESPGRQYRERSGPDIENVSLPFDVEIPPGASTLTVHYRARATTRGDLGPTATRLFPYVLAPARAWGSFGDLDVIVFVPEGWESSATPSLQREGNILRGHFDGLPADRLDIVVRGPVPALFCWAVGLAGVICGLGVIGGALLCWLAAGFVGRRAGTGLRFGLSVIAAVVLLPVLWAVCLFGSYVFAEWSVMASLRGQEAPYFHERYFDPIFVLMITPLILLGGVALTFVRIAGAHRAARDGPLTPSQRAAPSSPPPPSCP